MVDQNLTMARRLLDRLRELGRRVGGAVDEQLRPWDQRQVPVPVPVDVDPRAQRRGEDRR